MIKRLLTLTLVQSFLIQPVWAANLNEYRQGLLKSAGSTSAMSLDRLARIRRLLGTTGVTIQGLDGFQAQNTRNHRFYSSITMKEILQSGLNETIRAFKYDAQIPYDPSWSPGEHRAVLELAEKRRFVSAMMKARKGPNGDDGINIIVDELYAKLAVPEYARRSEPVPETDPVCLARGAELDIRRPRENAPAFENSVNQMRSAIAAHLAAGPRNTNNQSITDVLGQVGNVELIDGLVHRVFFGEGAEQLPVGLSFILTVRTGEDDTFVRIQELLLEYLKEQQRVFLQRQSELDVWISMEWLFGSPYSDLDGTWATAKSVAETVLSSAENRERAQHEIDEMFLMIQTEDEGAKYAAELQFFSEGRDFSKDSDLEESFINQRLKVDELLIPYLETKVATAKIGNTKMKALSRAQQNYLLDMYLQLRGTDLPTPRDLIALGPKFSTESERLLAGRPLTSLCRAEREVIDRLSADAMYYHVIANQLTDLESAILEEGSLEAARRSELNLIRSR